MKDIEIVKQECNAMDEYKEDGGMPFWDRKVTLIQFDRKGNWLAAKSVGGKKAMIEKMEKSDTFCCAWTGQYSTNIFKIDQPILRKIYKHR